MDIGRHRRVVALVAMAFALAACASGSGGQAGPVTPVSRTGGATGTSARTSTTSTSEPKSTGCAASTGPARGRSDETVRSSGRDRGYVRYVPPGLDASKPAPLVIDFTAYSPASLEESFSSFTKPDAAGEVKADDVGAVVVTPEPVNGEGLLTWNIDHTAGWSDDQRFVADLVDDVASHICIDPGRVLAMGFAIGAVMASTVACERPELVTVVATVSGLWDPPGCDPGRAVPVISFHGTGDHFLPFDGGVGDRVPVLGLSAETTTGLVAMASRPGAAETSAAWAARNGCDRAPTEKAVAPTVTRRAWSGCDADVELYVIGGGSHTWPGSDGMGAYEGLLGPVSDAVGANDVIWDFFTAHAPTT